MPVPPELHDLVERFHTNYKQYTSPKYKEARLRKEFLDPLFGLLGWDMANEAGLAEQYKEVVHEPSQEIEGGTKAPDYAFRIGEITKFFVEAKKPSIDIGRDQLAAFQLRRYAWSKNLPLSILTNFSDTAVYDGRFRPSKTDKPTVARVMHFTFQELEEKWENLAEIFSPEAIKRGSFDRYASETGKKRGTSEVDSEFLKEIEGWRDTLARNIALRNTHLSLEEMNFSVGKLVDRLIFLRICEDRGTEPYNQLHDIAQKESVYKNLHNLFERADIKYNSGLFHFRHEKGRLGYPDEITPKLKVDDKILRDIIRNLYYPDSPYQFDVITADILGQVYEQFLGKVIRLTEGHRAKVEEKPEVKKAGGVYYTPTYIVEYIVENTLGKLCAGKSPSEMTMVHVLDPACGSGSFLIVVYARLLKEHLDWYTANNPGRWKDAVFKGQKEDWHLTLQEKKRILLSSVYGVDIDNQAVEVTKLNLLLKALEGESEESVKNIKKWFREPALPDLGNNIKCGNSVVSFDVMDALRNMSEDDQETQLEKLNPFAWNGEDGFPSIIKSGGFDVVVGNPPYVFGRDWKSLGIQEFLKQYFKSKYPSSPYQLDMFSIFMEKAANLCRLNGYVGQIVPNVWLTNKYSSTTRSMILENSKNLTILAPKSRVFRGATVDTVVYTLQKSDKHGQTFVVRFYQDDRIARLAMHETEQYLDGKTPISTTLDSKGLSVLSKIAKKCTELNEIADVTRGVHPYRTGGYGRSAFSSGPQTKRDVEERPYNASLRKKGYRPFIYGRDLGRYTQPTARDFIHYGPWLAEPRKPEFFKGERIYSRKILEERLLVTIVEKDSVADQQVYITKIKKSDMNLRCLAGILGSRLMAFYIKGRFSEMNDTFPQIKVGQLKSLPIRKIDFNRDIEKSRHDRLVELVDRLRKLHENLERVKTPSEKSRTQRGIEATDEEIDALVYEMYGISDDEVRIIEKFLGLRQSHESSH